MSAVEPRHADTVSGFLCAFALTMAGLAVVRQPVLLATASIAVALLAARMTRAHRTLATITLAVATLSFFFGMLVAITTDSPLF